MQEADLTSFGVESATRSPSSAPPKEPTRPLNVSSIIVCNPLLPRELVPASWATKIAKFGADFDFSHSKQVLEPFSLLLSSRSSLLALSWLEPSPSSAS